MLRGLFVFFVVAGHVVAFDGPSLLQVEKNDLVSELNPSIHEDVGEFLLIELSPSSIGTLKGAGIQYEVVEANSGEQEYWLVKDFRAQGFASLSALVELVHVWETTALIKGERRIIGEIVPGLGFEVRKVWRETRRPVRPPSIGKGGLGDVLSQVSADSIESYIRWLESFGTRYTYTAQCTLAANALYAKFQEYGLDVDYFSFPYGLNVVATIPGEDMPDLVYIICGHYDSISEDPYNSAPGADDNASGTAAVIETARLLRNYAPRATVKFICFAGEEQGLWGSMYYARHADSVGMDIGGVVNFDMIAYCDLQDYFDVEVVTDHNSMPIAELLVREGKGETSAVPWLVVDAGAYWSDHAPFWIYGYPSVCGIERSTHHWNPYYHSTEDTTGTLTIPFATEVVKMGVAGLLRLARFFPEISFLGHEWVESGGDEHAEAGDTVSLTISLENSGKDALDVEAHVSTADPFIVLLDSISSFGEMQSDAVEDNGSDPFLFLVADQAPVHICTLQVDVIADSMRFRDTISIMVGIPPVLVIDGDEGDAYETYITQCFDRIDVLHDVLDVQEGVTSSYVQDYAVLVWLTGDKSSPVDPSDLASIRDFLDGGGNLFISGQDVEYCVDTSFYHNYLHAQLIADSTYGVRVDGVDGDALTNGISLLIMGSAAANNQVTPSIISPIGGADSVLSHRLGGCCGVKYAEDYRVAYFSFGFEAANPLFMADTLMMRILKWFGLPVGIEEEIAQGGSPAMAWLGVHPNPFRGEVEVEYFIPSPCYVELQVYDAAGRMVRQMLRSTATAGVHRVKWDGQNSVGSRVPQGAYFVRLCAGGTQVVEKSILLK